MTFAIPDDVGRRFRELVPPGTRSTVVANLLRKKVSARPTSAEAACRRVNRLEALEREMREWERFDDMAR